MKIIITFVIFLLFLFLDLPLSSQESLNFIDNKCFINPHREPCIFSHDDHNEKAGLDDCSICHHVYDMERKKIEDESSEDKLCSDCHSNKEIKNRTSLIKAFHLRCKKCHLKMKKGPLGCGCCHIKKNINICNK